MSAWWEPNRRSFGPVEALLILVGSTALVVWKPNWNVSWILWSFGIAFGAQRMLVRLGFPPDLVWKPLLITAVILIALPTVASGGHHNTPILWCATGFFVGAWSGREQERERTIR